MSGGGCENPGALPHDHHCCSGAVRAGRGRDRCLCNIHDDDRPAGDDRRAGIDRQLDGDRKPPLLVGLASCDTIWSDCRSEIKRNFVTDLELFNFLTLVIVDFYFFKSI